MIQLIPCFLLALLVTNAAALKITIAGHTVDLVNPLTQQSGSSKPSLASALCPVTTAADIQLTPFPIKTDNVCGSFGLGIASNAVACIAFGQMGAILANPPLRCAPDAVPVHPTVDPQGKHSSAAVETTATTGLNAWSSSCRFTDKKTAGELQAHHSPCTHTHMGSGGCHCQAGTHKAQLNSVHAECDFQHNRCSQHAG